MDGSPIEGRTLSDCVASLLRYGRLPADVLLEALERFNAGATLYVDPNRQGPPDPTEGMVDDPATTYPGHHRVTVTHGGRVNFHNHPDVEAVNPAALWLLSLNPASVCPCFHYAPKVAQHYRHVVEAYVVARWAQDRPRLFDSPVAERVVVGNCLLPEDLAQWEAHGSDLSLMVAAVDRGLNLEVVEPWLTAGLNTIYHLTLCVAGATVAQVSALTDAGIVDPRAQMRWWNAPRASPEVAATLHHHGFDAQVAARLNALYGISWDDLVAYAKGGGSPHEPRVLEALGNGTRASLLVDSV